MSRLRPRVDDGSVLVMALLFLSLIGIVIAAVIGFANTGFKTASAVHSTTKTQYAADAAIEGAINKIRGDITTGKDSNGAATPCFNLVGASEVNAIAVDVTCTGRDLSGATTGGAGGGLSPANSVLTLPTNTNEGVTLSTTATPLVSGDVITSEVLSVPAGGTLTVQGALTCKTRNVAVPGAVTATTETACPSAASTVDPNYTAEITTRPAAAALPLSCAGTTISFTPGWYSSAAALNGFTNAGPGCTSKRFHFTPGVYYFEFADVLPAGTHLWTINDPTAEVVGGTLTAPATAFPNRCDLALAGVQFIFGSDSRLAVTAGSLELCPPISAGQRIALYGAKDTPAVGSTTVTINPTTATSTPVGSESNTYTPLPAAALDIDGVETVFTASTNKGVGVLNLSGFAGVPGNAEITAAFVRVASRYQNTYITSPASDLPSLTLTPGDGSAALSYAPNPCLVSATCTAATEVSINVFGQINTPARANGLAMAYRIKDRQGTPYLISRVNGVELDITYNIPGLKGTNTPLTVTVPATIPCTVVAPYASTTPAATCPVFRGTGGATAKMAIKGTIYAPLGAVDLSMTGQLNAVTQRGVIARTLHLGVNHGAPYTGALLAMPGSADRKVLLTATIGGSPKLRADVTFEDGLGATPGSVVTVRSWSVLR